MFGLVQVLVCNVSDRQEHPFCPAYKRLHEDTKGESAKLYILSLSGPAAGIRAPGFLFQTHFYLLFSHIFLRKDVGPGLRPPPSSPVTDE